MTTSVYSRALAEACTLLGLAGPNGDPTVLALADRLAALMTALEAADRFGREVTRRMLILPDGMCAACGAQLPPSVHHPGCWLRPLMRDVRETFADAGVPMPALTVFVCGPSSPTCHCACPESCGHVWDGLGIELPDRIQSVTCSRCGMAASSHDLRVMP